MNKKPTAQCLKCGYTGDFRSAMSILAIVDGYGNLIPGTIESRETEVSQCVKCGSFEMFTTPHGPQNSSESETPSLATEVPINLEPTFLCLDCGNGREFKAAMRIGALADGYGYPIPGTIKVQETYTCQCVKCGSRKVSKPMLCTECGKKTVFADDAFPGDDGPVCPTCANENYCACTQCGTGARWHQITNPNEDDWLCPACARKQGLLEEST